MLTPFLVRSKASDSVSPLSNRSSVLSQRASPCSTPRQLTITGLHDDDRSKYTPCGNVVVELDGKKFYHAVRKGVDLIKVGDSVDVVVRFVNSEKCITRLAKIAAIFQDGRGEMKAEVAYYYDTNDVIPGVHRRFIANKSRLYIHKNSNWRGFTHHNEVVASNEFEFITVDAIDEVITVHENLEAYQAAVDAAGDEAGHYFCQVVCYTESYALKPFDSKSQWRQVMLESSEFHRVYHMGFMESPTGRLQAICADKGKVILGREEEAATIRTFIETGIRQGGTGQLLYVSGVPGTGKTATVNMIVREISDKKLSAKLPWFDLVEINGVHLVDPNDFYRILYGKLMKKSAVNHIAAYKELDEYFMNNQTPCVLIIDEADYIVTRKQKVLFTIFDWPSRRKSKLIVVIISNTMDLPSRMKASCVSRLAFGSLVFQPYRYQQILDVLSSQEDIKSAIDPVALQLCARRVTNYSGDMRKALQICKLALATAKDGKVSTAEMNRVSNTVLSSAAVESLQHQSDAMSCLLVALVLELRETQLSVACARKVYHAFRGMMAVMKPEFGKSISLDTYRQLLVSASLSGIISLEPSAFNELNTKRRLQLYEELGEELGDTAIVPEIDVGHIITALSRNPYWEQKLRDL
ncbi:origin recognition complex subunit 1, putative [Babesia bigemina]|uniref:Origin recognition complex subunit 1 n=1 Tax=Babesia bigemina TaxID=5866 RepID=A0A061DBD9_BABBI|nr:origin recognition complex subunit 1, putative [Babesia bigemina]CDR98016.1 origin recognition complex subunit 1, putative [Babesia bigemina]|eukprot:XP_012770202.1 origin recognition complex subunit 1, putative [Babesia bigemina]